jgi:hypothetical protein
MVDLSLDTDSVTKTTDLENVIQQIEMLFDTSPFEVIGEPMFGSDFERFLWDLNASNYDIEQYIVSRIHSAVELLGFQVDVHVSIMKGTENDIILADIVISRDGREYTKTYKIDQI